MQHLNHYDYVVKAFNSLKLDDPNFFFNQINMVTTSLLKMVNYYLYFYKRISIKFKVHRSVNFFQTKNTQESFEKMKEIISINMGKFLAVKGANINILLNVILLAVNQVNKICV